MRPKLTKEEGWLDWAEPAIRLDRKIRAFNPRPVAHTRFRQRVLRVWEARPRKCGDRWPSAVPGDVVAADRAGMHVFVGRRCVVTASGAARGRQTDER